MIVTTLKRVTVTLEEGVTVDLADITAKKLIAMGLVKGIKGKKNKNSEEENSEEKKEEE